MHFFGSAALAALGILGSSEALAAARLGDGPCDSLRREIESECVAGSPSDGTASWLAGAARHLEPAGVEDLFRAPAAEEGPVDFGSLPLLTTEKTIPFRVRVDGTWSKIEVRLGGDVLDDVRIAKGSVRTRSHVALRPGVNVFTVRLSDGKRAPVEVHASIRRLRADQVEDLAVARAYLETVGPVLGTEAGPAALLPVRFDAYTTEQDKGATPLTRIGFDATLAGVPVVGGGVSVLVTRDPATKKAVGVGMYNSLPDFSKAPIKLPKTVAAAEARTALARAYAGGDERFISQPVLRWRVDPEEGGLKLMYQAFFYGLHADDENFDTEQAFTIARLWTDPAGATQHEYQDAVRRQFALDGHGRVFDGPLHDLDQGLQVHRVELEEFQRDLEGEREWCASGPYAEVKNDSESEHLAYNSRGRLACGGLDRNALPDLDPHAPNPNGDATREDDLLEAWTVLSHTNIAAEFIRRHTGFVHDFPRADRPSQLLLGINPQFEGYAAAVTNLVASRSGTRAMRQGIFFGQEVRWGITTYDGEAYFMAADFARDRNAIYHEYGHTILNAFGVTTLNAYLNGITGVVHEGFADYVARVLTGNERQPSEFLYGDPEAHPDARARFCSASLPGDEHFLALDADSISRTMADEPRWLQGHVYGQAFCQALALVEHRLAELTDLPGHAVLRIAVAAAADYRLHVWRRDQTSPFVQPLLFASTAQWVIQQFQGLGTRPTDHELHTALSLHGFTGDPQGRTAAIMLKEGAHRTYTPEDERIDAMIATGVNEAYRWTISRDDAGDDVCFTRDGDTTLVDPARTTRMAESSVTIENLLRECGEGRLFVDVSSCALPGPCAIDGGPDYRAGSGSRLWVDVGAG